MTPALIGAEKEFERGLGREPNHYLLIQATPTLNLPIQYQEQSFP